VAKEWVESKEEMDFVFESGGQDPVDILDYHLPSAALVIFGVSSLKNMPRAPSIKIKIALASCLLSLVLIPGLSRAESDQAPSSNNSSDINEERKTELFELNDPTILKRKIGLENRFTDLDNGAARFKANLEGLFAMGLSSNIDFGLRLRLPMVVHYFKSNSPGDSDATGLGDIEFAFGPAFRLRKNLRTFFGLETQFNSATNDKLGDDSIILRPLYTLAWSATSFMDAVLNLEYSNSVFEETGQGDTNNLLIAIPITFSLPKSWSLTFEWRGKAIFVNPKEFQNSIRPGVAKAFKKVPVTLFAKFDIPINDARFETRFGFFYYFK